MSQEDKKKLLILLGLVGVFAVVAFFTMVLPSMKKRGGQQEQPMLTEGGPSPGAPPGMPGGGGMPMPGGPPGSEGKAPGGPGPSPGAPPGAGSPGMPPGMPAGGPGMPPAGGGAAPPGMPGGGAPGGGAQAATAAATPVADDKTPLLPSREDPFAPEGGAMRPAHVRLAKSPPTYGFERLAVLPPIRILEESPAQKKPPAPPTGRVEIPESPDKRLSGVLMNRGIYTILERTVSLDESGTGRKGYIVKPGDQVEGMQVIKIERSRNGREIRTTMILQEPNGEKKLVRLKPGPPPPQQTGVGPGGMPGPGGPGGMPGMGPGGGFPPGGKVFR